MAEVRGDRGPLFGNPATPAVVGPGRYTVNPNPEVVVPSYAAFASSSARVLNPNQTTSAITPGPGAYKKEADEHKGRTGAPAFRSTVTRMAPVAPGSTEFQEGTSACTPGPGAYTDPKALKPRKKVPAHKGAAQNPGLLVVPNKAPPSIPVKGQANGYDAQDGSLVLRPPPLGQYSGLGQDTVGPAFYNPSASVATTKKVVPDFGRGERKLWNPKPIPGPGAYDPPADINAAHMAPRSGGTSSFASKVPVGVIAEQRTEAPGPGAYEYSQLSKPESRGYQGFGSTVPRSGWQRNPYTPFSDGYHVFTPGPGAYLRHGAGGKQSEQDNEAPVIPFASTAVRECSQPVEQDTAPGPGSYGFGEPKPNSAPARSLHGGFGAASARFKGGMFDRQRASVAPGPGAYDFDGEHPGSRGPRQSAAFSSTSQRFKGNMESNEVHIVGDNMTPTATQYNIKQSWVHSQSNAKLTGRDKPSFASTAPRFKLAADQITESPGPGAYVSVGLRGNSKSPARGVSKVDRFNGPGSYIAKAVEAGGPGAYETRNSMIKRSYNVTMK